MTYYLNEKTIEGRVTKQSAVAKHIRKYARRHGAKFTGKTLDAMKESEIALLIPAKCTLRLDARVIYDDNYLPIGAVLATESAEYHLIFLEKFFSGVEATHALDAEMKPYREAAMKGRDI